MEPRPGTRGLFGATSSGSGRKFAQVQQIDAPPPSSRRRRPLRRQAAGFRPRAAAALTVGRRPAPAPGAAVPALPPSKIIVPEQAKLATDPRGELVPPTNYSLPLSDLARGGGGP